MKTLKTQAIVGYGLSVLALGLLAAPTSALAAHHRHHVAHPRASYASTQQAAPQAAPCQIHFQTGCSGY